MSLSGATDEQGGWYFHKAGSPQPHGPVSRTEIERLLAGGALSSHSKVWHPSFGSVWQTIAEVGRPPNTSPPPIAPPPMLPQSPPMMSGAGRVGTSSGGHRLTRFLVLAVGLIIVVSYFGRSPKPEDTVAVYRKQRAEAVKARGWTDDQYDQIIREYGGLYTYDKAKEKGMNAAQYQTYVSQVAACKVDWQKCADNAQFVNESKSYDEAKIDCRMKADASARFGKPEWEFPWFSTFLKGDEYIRTGKAHLIDETVRFSNGFGAMARARVECLYDLREKKVIDVSVRQF